MAIVVAAIVISAAAFSYSSFEATVTKTVSTNSVSVSTVTSTITGATTLTTTSTELSTITVSPSSAVINSPVKNDHELSAAIQPTVASLGQNITIIATVLDVGSTTFEMNTTGLVNPVYGPCAQAFATGVYAYSGYYSSANVSQANQLLIYNPNLIHLCPTQSIFHHTFSPLSGMTEVSVLTGYWTGSSFQPFPAGVYTMSVFDAYGQVAIGHFQVVPAQLYQVTFQQLPCAGDYAVPWSVTLGSQTVVMPANATVPSPGQAELQPDPNASTIVFAVAPGSYTYTILPTAGFEYTVNTTGTITITNANGIIQLSAECHP